MAGVIEKSLWIAAPPDAVFDAYCDPARAVRWLGFSLEFEPREGGRYAVNMELMGLVEGQVLEFDRPSFLHHTCGDVGETRGSHVRITFTEEAGGTRILLSHTGVRQEGADRIWDHHLARLAVVAAGGEPGFDPLLGEFGFSETESSTSANRSAVPTT
jgi:uncharacterized protein YndB with AHSA1/START domain